MQENPIMMGKSDLLEKSMFEICKYLTKSPCTEEFMSLNGCYWSVGPLKKNHDNLKVRGDFSLFASKFTTCNERKFSDRVENKEYWEVNEENNELKQIAKDSKSWKLPVTECVFKGGRMLIYLNREITFKSTLNAVFCKEAEYGSKLCGSGDVCISSDSTPDVLDLSHLRLILTRQLFIEVLSKQGFSVSSANENKEDCVRLHLTLNPALKLLNSFTIVVGVVRNLHTNRKETDVNAEHYQRIREKDMVEASMHKYGSNVSEGSWKGFISSLASSSIKLDLLQSKVSHPVSLDLSEGVVSNREKSYRGPQFLLYNYARLVSILRSFDKKVNEAIYPSLISLEDVDFSLLSEEEEWELLLNYILPYPSLLSQALNINSQKFETQILIQFLQRLCTKVSVYYSRHRILLEPRSHLLPLMNARIYLLLAIKQIMLNIFHLFNIVPVSQM